MQSRGLYDHRGRLVQLRGQALEWWTQLRRQGELTGVSSAESGLWIGNEVTPVLLIGTQVDESGTGRIPVINPRAISGDPIPLVTTDAEGSGGFGVPINQFEDFSNHGIPNSVDEPVTGIAITASDIPAGGKYLELEVHTTYVGITAALFNNPTGAVHVPVAIGIFEGVGQPNPVPSDFIFGLNSGVRAIVRPGDPPAVFDYQYDFPQTTERSSLFLRSRVENTGLSIWTWWKRMITDDNGNSFYRQAFVLSSY